MPRECPVTLQPILHPVMCNDGKHYELEAIVEHCIGKTKAQLLCPLTNVKLISVFYSLDMKEDLDNEYASLGGAKLEKRYQGYKDYTKDEYLSALNAFFAQDNDATPFTLPPKKQKISAPVAYHHEPQITNEQLWAIVDERGDEPPANAAELIQLLRLPPRREISPSQELPLEQEFSSRLALSPERELSSRYELSPRREPSHVEDLFSSAERFAPQESTSRENRLPILEGAEIASAFVKIPVPAASDDDMSNNIVSELPEPDAFDNSAALLANPMPSFSLHPYREQLAEAPNKDQLLEAIKFFEVGKAHAHKYPNPTPYSIAPYRAEYTTVPASQREEYVENLRMFQHGMNEEQKSGLHEEYFCEDCEKDINLAKEEVSYRQTMLSDRHFLNLLIKHGAALLTDLPAQNPLADSNITLANLVAAADKRADRGQFDLGPYILSHQALCRDLKSYDIFNLGKNDPVSAAIIIDTSELYNQLRTRDQQELNLTVNTGEGIDRRYPRSHQESVNDSASDTLCAACEKDLNYAKAEVLNKYTTLSATHLLQLLEKHGVALLPDLVPQNLFQQTKIRLPHLVATAEKRADIGRYILAHAELWPDLKRRDVFRIGKNFATNASIILGQDALNNKLLPQGREELGVTMRTGEGYDQRQNHANQNADRPRPRT